MEICDLVNEKPENCRTARLQLQKKLGTRNAKETFKALIVLETLVKNCGEPMHRQVSVNAERKEKPEK
jgi:hypothetical protein